MVMVLAAYQAISNAQASNAAPSYPTVTGGGPVSAAIGEAATVTATIGGGVPLSPVSGTFSGYYVLWFYGETTSSGGIGYEQALVPAPSSCTDVGAVCDATTTVSFTHTYTGPGSFLTSFTVYDAVGDYSTGTELVTVSPPTITVHPTSSATAASEDATITFSATSTTMPASYESDQFAYRWDFGDGNFTWGSPVDHAYDMSGNYAVTVTGYDNRTGAVAEAFITNIRITDPGPQAALSLTTPTTTPGTHPEDTTVGFSAAGTTAVPSALPHLRYWWNFGDGTLGAGITSSHEYTAPGEYTVTLIAIDPEGMRSTATGTVDIVDPGPSASTAATPTSSIGVGTVAILDGSATTAVPTDLPGLNYTWATGVSGVTDMASSFGVIGRAGYFEPGTYPVGLSVVDPWGEVSSAGTTQTIVDTPPNVGLYSAYTLVNISVALGGTPDNTVNVSVLQDGNLTNWGEITRSHGNPANDVLVIPGVHLSLADRDTILVSYAGGTSPKGANPVDVTLTFWGDSGGSFCTTKATKSLCQPQEFKQKLVAGGGNGGNSNAANWTIDGNAVSLGQVVFLSAQVFSPGRSPLSTTWDFGDGVQLVSSTPIPSTAEPTLGVITATHRWLPGSSYTLTLKTTDASGRTDTTSIPVGEGTGAEVADVAPMVTLTTPSELPQSPDVPLNAQIRSENYGATSFDVQWQFGDGASLGQLGVGASAVVGHLYRYSNTLYALVIYASDGTNGYTTASWSFLTISSPPAAPVFHAPSGPVTEFSLVEFDASASTEYPGAPAGQDLSFGWSYGEAIPAGVLRASSPVVAHQFTSEGTFPVTLTVWNAVGQSASVTQDVTVADVPVVASMAPRTVMVDELAVFSPTVLAGAPTDSAMLQGTWDWGDGSPTSTGLAAGHTYLEPGTFTVGLTLSDDDGTAVGTVQTTVTVLDQPLSVILPYDGYTVYGETHSAEFHATVLTSAADATSGGTFTYTWNFGDATPGATATVLGLVGSVDHTYAIGGNAQLSVNVTGPYETAGSANASLLLVPNTDGDGIPDEYGLLLLGIQPGSDPSQGTGLNDFVSAFIVHGQNATADTDHDGLTDFQEVFGTVTGYVSNPLDPNTAGDGLLDGSHQFTDSFASNQVVDFTSAGTAIIPPVQYGGNTAAITNIELYDEVVSPSLSSLSVSIQPVVPTLGGIYLPVGNSISLGTPTDVVENYTLLTNSPVGGVTSSYGLALSQFTSVYGWAVSVSGGSGTIEMAQILINYYTDPNLADPYASGLTLGHGFSTPVFNLSEPLDANFTVFHGDSMTYSTVDYYPYTEQYYKLSVVQGVPYYPWDNVSYQVGATGVGDPQAFATYYGDKEFHIAPWQTHAAGDPILTNGMKAYGATNYDLTANRYLLPSGQGEYATSQLTPYVHDSISYGGPLNPTAYSTGTNGVADSSAENPVGGPEVLGFYIGGAETKSISVFDFGADSNAGGVVQIQDTDYSGSPSLYTPSVSGSNNYQFGDTSINWMFSYGDYYQLPITSNAGTFRIYLSVFLNYDLKAGSEGSTTITFANAPGTYQSYNQGGFYGYGEVYTLSRMPVILVNSTNEVHDLKGYGYHWAGDQQFYAFYLSITDSGGGPFQSGLNLVLVSRPAFVNSTLNTTFANQDTSAVPFLNGASLSQRGGSSDAAIAGTLTASLNTANAEALLADLIPYNATGHVMGGYEALSQTQFELLGLDGNILSSAPYFALSGYNSPVGQPSTSFWQALGNLFTSVADAIVSVVLAIGNFIVSVANEIGQAIVGAWNQFAAAVASAIKAIAKAFDFILQWITEQLNQLLNDAKDAFNRAVTALDNTFVLPFLSFMRNIGALSADQFNASYQNIASHLGVSDPPGQDNQTASSQLSKDISIGLGILSGVAILVGTVSYIIAVATAGAGEAVEETAQVAGDAAEIPAAVSGVAAAGATIAGLVGLFAVVGTLITQFSPDSAASQFFNSLTDSTMSSALTSSIENFLGPALGLIGDLIFTIAAGGLGGLYVSGIIVSVVSLVITTIAGFLTSVVAQLVLDSIAVLLSLVGLFIQVDPLDLGVEDATDTGFVGIAGIILSIGGLLGAGASLTQAISTYESG